MPDPTAPIPAACGPEVRLDLDYTAPQGRLHAALRGAPALLEVTMAGVGDDAGVRAFLAFLDQAEALLAPGEKVRVRADLSALTRVPMSAPLNLGRWILAHRSQLEDGEVVVGSIVLRKMQSFGMKALVVADPYLPLNRLRELGITPIPFDDVLRKSDIVSVHLPLTDETKGMFDMSRFRLMKESAIFINTSRGPVVNIPDLIKALKDRIIAGAGLDVLDNEPPQADCELLSMKNVVLTPHLSWYTEEAGWDIRHMIMDDLKTILEGKMPQFVVNPEVFDRPELRMKMKN